jgi:hypothetical protein
MIYSLLSLNRSFLLVMKWEIIFRDFLTFDLDFYLYQFILAALQFESELNSNDLFFWISFQSNSCRFAVKAILDFRKSSNSCRFAFYFRKHNKSSNSCRFAFYLRKSLNFYNDVRFWITRKSIRKKTNYNHEQKRRKSEEKTSDAKNNNLKKTQFQELWSLKAISRRIWWLKRDEFLHYRLEDIKENFVLFFVFIKYESWKNAIIYSSKHCLKFCKKTLKRFKSKKNLLTTSKNSIQTSLIIWAKQTSMTILEIIRDTQNHD